MRVSLLLLFFLILGGLTLLAIISLGMAAASGDQKVPEDPNRHRGVHP